MKPTVDCLIGLQWGSEGKGKIAAYLAPEYNGMVRSGGCQAGHTFYHKSKKFVNRQIPCGVINPKCKLHLSANSIINLDVLIDEIIRYNLCSDRLVIDEKAMIIEPCHIRKEIIFNMRDKIGSTTEGVGAALAEKILRKARLFKGLVSNYPSLLPYCNDSSLAINCLIEQQNSILLEGTQGFGLSLNYGNYPFVTSKDITACALLNDAGISSRYLRQSIGILRTYPIRVGGNSGPTGSSELSWKEITLRCNSPYLIEEYTTVTNRKRRIFEQSKEQLIYACRINRPDQLALTFIDYIDYADKGKNHFDTLSTKSKDYVARIEDLLQIPVTLIGTGPHEKDIIDRRNQEQKARPHC